jgi:hypothetical protein
VEVNLLVPTPDEVAALNVTLTDGDWRLVWGLWRSGVAGGGIYRLLRLRAAHRERDLSMDGLEADPHARFARWLVATGRLNEGQQVREPRQPIEPTSSPGR